MRPEPYVFFDVDDTLIQWTVSWSGVFAQAAAEVGVEVSAEEALGALNAAFSTFYTDCLRKYAPQGDEREFWLEYNGRIFETLGVKGKDRQRRAAQRVTELLKRERAMALFPEVPEALGELRGRGARLGIVTGRPRAEPDLEALGVLDYFEVVMDGLSAGEGKRVGGALFRRAAEVAVEAGAIGWHVGDSYEHDVEAARAAGLRAVLVDRGGSHPEADCHRISDLRELAAIVTREQPEANL